MISTQTLAGALVLVVARLVWVVYRRSVVKSPLRNLPGPPVISWRTGHLGHLYNPSGMSWHHELNQTYGGACLIKGIMGVNIQVDLRVAPLTLRYRTNIFMSPILKPFIRFA